MFKKSAMEKSKVVSLRITDADLLSEEKFLDLKKIFKSNKQLKFLQVFCKIINKEIIDKFCSLFDASSMSNVSLQFQGNMNDKNIKDYLSNRIGKISQITQFHAQTEVCFLKNQEIQKDNLNFSNIK